MASRAHTKRVVRLGLDFRKHQHGIWTAFFLPALLSIRPTSSKKAINPSCHAMQTQSRLTRAPDFFKRDCSRLGGVGMTEFAKDCVFPVPTNFRGLLRIDQCACCSPDQR